MLSFDYWTTAFGADPAVVGKTLVVSGQPLEIVGVTPRGFEGATPGANPSVFAPITLEWFSDARTAHADRRGPVFRLRLPLRRGDARGLARRRPRQGSTRRFARSSMTSRHPRRRARPGDRDLTEFRARDLSLVSGARGQLELQRSRAHAAHGVLRGDRHDPADRVRESRESDVRARCVTDRRDRRAGVARRCAPDGCMHCCPSRRCCSRACRAAELADRARRVAASMPCSRPGLGS